MTLLHRAFVAVVVAIAGGVVWATPSYAMSLRIQPASVTSSLSSNERKKGFVDIVNPTGNPVIVSLSVQAFRQVDSAGMLEFYDDSAVTKGLLLDYDKVELLGHEALRLYYVADGTKLPKHDVLAAIFATVSPKSEQSASAAVRVGTIVVLQRDSVKRQLQIQDLEAPMIQLGDGIEARFALKNTAAPINAFYPDISVTTWPYGDENVTGPLVAAGNQRQIEYIKKGSYVGPLKLTIRSHGASKTLWVVAATGYWRWVLPAILFVGAVVLYIFRRHKRTANH